jgi:ABC-type sulfate transport system substrate-binding protein
MSDLDLVESPIMARQRLVIELLNEKKGRRRKRSAGALIHSGHASKRTVLWKRSVHDILMKAIAQHSPTRPRRGTGEYERCIRQRCHCCAEFEKLGVTIVARRHNTRAANKAYSEWWY